MQAELAEPTVAMAETAETRAMQVELPEPMAMQVELPEPMAMQVELPEPRAIQAKTAEHVVDAGRAGTDESDAGGGCRHGDAGDGDVAILTREAMARPETAP